jgi:CHAT domain-containing protein
MLLPQAARLRGKRLIIVPDGPLHHVPFEALVHKGRFLIEDHEISVVPSSTTLLLMRSQASSRAGITFLGVGDPVPGGGDDLVLPYSRIELEKIAGLFEEPARTLLTGRSATRTALKSLDLTRYRFVHFATHGLLKEGERRTGMWLGATTKDGSDSVLTLDDVLSMRMDANLVVLSACRSGLGELIDGEGLISLTRAFLYAGSRSVVVALWDVNDASTVDFMKVFYGGLRSGDAPAAALRKAKLSFIRSDRAPRREPYRWAPFILVGAPPS